MSQPKWKLVGNLGDATPLEYGGYWVYTDETGVYAPEAEIYFPETGEVYRFILEPCTFDNGILSDNPYHKDHPVWFDDSIKGMASFVGIEPSQLVAEFLSDDPLERADAWRTVGDYHGYDNLDSYPLVLTAEEAEKRYGNA